MSPGDLCSGKTSSSQKVSRAKFRMRIGFAPLPRVAARTCFSRTRKIQKRSMSRSRRLTTPRRLGHRKRSGSKTNCPGSQSTIRCRHSRRAHKPPEREKKFASYIVSKTMKKHHFSLFRLIGSASIFQIVLSINVLAEIKRDYGTYPVPPALLCLRLEERLLTLPLRPQLCG